MEAIYATDSMGGIAKNSNIPWYSKKDLQFFKNKTKHNVVIMGKNTYLSLPNGYLRNRLNVVLSTNPNELYLSNKDNSDFVIVTNNDNIYSMFLQHKEKWKNLFPYLHDNYKVFIIGGKTIYEKYIPLCKTIWVTKIKKDHDCDLFFFYDYSKYYNEELIDDDDELQIVRYDIIF